MNIDGKSSITLQCKNGEKRVLKDVYYIPTLCTNIISPGQISEEGNKIVIHEEMLWIYDNEGELLMKVKWSSNSLYKLLLKLVSLCVYFPRLKKVRGYNTRGWDT